MDKLELFIPLAKVDVARREVWGTLAAEEPDHSGEILDYAKSKPRFEAWSQGMQKASDGKSLGNVRAMHGRVAAGRLVAINFDDGGKRITGGAHIVDDQEWAKVLAGVYTGFSVGGSYGDRWPDDVQKALTRYEALPVEISIVDAPCIPGATFQVVKADGSLELRKFVEPAAADAETPAEPAPDSLQKVAADAAALDQRLAELEARRQPAEPLAKTDAATVMAVENMLDMAADAEEAEDATEKQPGDQMVEVSITTLAVLHEQIVALGAPCPMRYPERYREQMLEDGDYLPGNTMEYVLGQIHDTLVALGAECVAPDEVAKAAFDELAKASGLDEDAELAKAGKRISGANMMQVQSIHDAAAKLGAACGGMGKSASATAVEDGILDGLRKQLGTLQANLAKAVGERSAIEATVTQLTERLVKLEEQPLPGGPLLSTEGLVGKTDAEIRALVVEKRLAADDADAADSAPDGIDGQIAVYKDMLMKVVDPGAKQEIAARLSELRIKKAQQG